MPLGKADRNTRFQLVVKMSSLGTQRIPFTAAPAVKLPSNGPRIVGSVDANSDGRAEIFVMIDSGASTQFWTIFKLVNHRIMQVTIAGQPARLAVGGSVMNDFGFSCGRPRSDLVIYGYGALSAGIGSQKWSVERDTYRWAGARALYWSRSTPARSARPRGALSSLSTREFVAATSRRTPRPDPRHQASAAASTCRPCHDLGLVCTNA